MKEDMVDIILDMPDAPRIVEAVSSVLARERQKRLDFYEWVTPNMKAEFINGEIIIHSPVMKRHENSSGWLYKLLSDFVEQFDIGYAAHEKLMVSLSRNDYEPDICFFPKAVAEDFTEDQVRFPAPALVIEILSKSTKKIDREVKFTDYALHGVQEYWLVEPQKQTIEQFKLHRKEFVLENEFEKEGNIKSLVVEGFEIPVMAAFDKNTYQTARKMLGI